MEPLSPPNDPVVGQGPGAVSSLVLDPPGWLTGVLLVTALGVALAASRRLSRRGWTVTADEQREMLHIAGTVFAVASATLLVLRYLDGGYLLDVAAGVGLGYGVVLLAQLGVQSVVSWSERFALTVGWAVVAVGAVAVLPLAPASGLALAGLQSVLSLFGGGMVVYNAARA